MELSDPTDSGHTFRPASLLPRLGLPPRTHRRRRRFERISQRLATPRFLPKVEFGWLAGERVRVVGNYGVAEVEYEEVDRVFAEVE